MCLPTFTHLLLVNNSSSSFSTPSLTRTRAALHLEHRRLQAREIAGRTVPEMEKVLHDYLNGAAGREMMMG